jgi:hypothetical protein
MAAVNGFESWQVNFRLWQGTGACGIVGHVGSSKRGVISMRRFTLVVAVMLMVVACGSGADAGTPGEIVGLNVLASLDADNHFGPQTYVGTVVVRLPDVGEVTARCTKECCPDVGGESVLDEIISGRHVALTLDVIPPWDALLVQGDAGEWEVIEILE